MLCREIMDVIERTYPKHAALGWDNVGLLAGRTEKVVNKIYVALDATDEAIDAAIAAGADMLVTHHPLIFSPLKKITDEHFIGSRVVKLLQHDISYYAMHTNYDVLGMGKLADEILEIKEAAVLDVTDEINEKGIGTIGRLEHKISLRECCSLVKSAFELENVRVFWNQEFLDEKKIECAAIVPGSGSKMIETAIAKGADVLITGDIDHHSGIDAVAQGIAVIDAGHYGLEHIFVEDMARYLEENLEQIEVMRDRIIHPFQVI